MDWGSALTAGTCRQFYDHVCFIAPLGTDVVNDHLLWVHVSYCSAIHCSNGQVFVQGSFLCFGFGSLWFSPFFMTLELGLTKGCLWTSGARATAFACQWPFFLQPLHAESWAGQLCLPGGCWWVQLGHSANDICSIGSCAWQVWHTACTAWPTHIAATPDSTV